MQDGDPRDELDDVLAALLRERPAGEVAPYVRRHDALAPTSAEVLARQAAYVALLGVAHGPSVRLAQRELARLAGAPGLDAGEVVAASTLALERTDRVTVVGQVRLLAALARADPALPVADALRLAAEHPRADVRALVARELGRLGEPVPARTRAVGFFFAPAPAARPAVAAVVPVADADELIALLLELLDEVDPLGLERAIDGLLRFGDQRPPSARPLAERIKRPVRPGAAFPGDPREAVRVLARAWLTRRRIVLDGTWAVELGRALVPDAAARPGTLIGAAGQRLTAIARALRDGLWPAVALPATADGLIPAEVLSSRLAVVAAAGRRLPGYELEVALRRVPPEDRALVEVPVELSRAAPRRPLLDATGPAVGERRTVVLRPVPWAPEVRVVRFGAEGTLAQELQYGTHEPRFEQAVALGAALLPQDPDRLAALAHPYLARDLTWDRSCTVPVHRALGAARSANGAAASSALVLGLAAKDARARGAAQDAVLDLARYGVLDGAALGEQAALLLGEGLVVGRRLSTGLREVAGAGDAAVPPLVDALAALPPVLVGRHDRGPFIELAAELGELTGRRAG
ncbi:hypothetical protein ABFU82_02590 [Nocardioides sp. WV_118_6]